MTSDPNLPSENPIYSCLQYIHFNSPSIDFQFSIRNSNLPSVDPSLPSGISIYHLQIQMIQFYSLEFEFTIQMFTSLPSGISIYHPEFQFTVVDDFNYRPEFQFTVVNDFNLP